MDCALEDHKITCMLENGFLGKYGIRESTGDLISKTR